MPPPPDAPPPPGAGAPRPARAQAVRQKAVRGPAGADDEPRVPKTPPPPVDDAKATMRGYIVIGVTVLLGLLIFVKGMSQQTDPSVQATSLTTLPQSNVSTSINRDTPPPTTLPGQGTTLPRTVATNVAPKDTKIVVANGVDPSKVIAGPIADKLSKALYTVNSKVDLQTKSDKTFVYYNENFLGEAQAIAKVLELPDTSVTAMPKTPPTPVGSSQILVVIGTDEG